MKLKMTFLALLLGGSAMAQVPLKVATKGDTLKIEDATRITYSDDLSEQTIHTLSGEEQKQALNNVWEVIFGDTLHNIIDYLDEDMECNVFRWAVYSGSSKAEAGGGFMGPLHYYSKFQTEGHQFAFFVPVDEGYMFPQPISFLSRHPRVCLYKMKSKVTGGANANPIEATLYNYDVNTGEVGNEFRTESVSNSDIVNELQQQLMQHTVFFERPEDKAAGIRSGNEYYKTLAGTYIRVNNDSMRVQGAYQMENEAKGFSNFTHSQIVDLKQKQNGTIYKVDSPISYPAQNTYDVLWADYSEDSPYAEFFKLCSTLNDSIIIQAFQLEQYSGDKLYNMLNHYSVFSDNKGRSVGETLSFFNNQDFTLYVPTNEAVRQAIADGLPTPESIEALYHENKGENENVSEEVRLELQRQVLELTNFVKYHFHFGSEVADKLPFAARTHNTPVVLRESLTTPKLTVSSNGNGTLSVTDARGNVRNVIGTHKNIFVREVWTNRSPEQAVNMTGINVESSSPGVIHLIDGVLRYK